MQLLQRFWQSPALLVMPFILLVSAAASAATSIPALRHAVYGPEERLFVLSTLDKNARLAGKTNDAKSVVILSSSLGIYSAAMTDALKYKEPDLSTIDFMKYSKFRVLDDKFAELGKVKTRTLNLSNSAMMISEQALMLKELLRQGCKPDLVILEIAPRDFLDHYTAAYHRSRLSQILMIRQSPLSWDFGSSASDNLNRLLAKIWGYYSQRVEFRDYLVQAVCEYFDRASSLYGAQARMAEAKLRDVPVPMPEADADAEKPDSTAGNARLGAVVEAAPSAYVLKKSLSDYRGRYLPIDNDRWKLELDALGDFCDFAQKTGVPTLIVGMPLPAVNREILPKTFLAQYSAGLNELLAKYSEIQYLDLLDSSDFQLEDFIDSCHLRGQGGAKLAGSIAKAKSGKGKGL